MQYEYHIIFFNQHKNILTNILDYYSMSKGKNYAAKKGKLMNYYNEIKIKLIDNEIYCKTKDYSKEKNTILTYYEIGKLLSEAGSKYGTNIIEEYSKKLQIEVGKKYNKSTLFRMKQFYNIFSDEKVAPLAQQLSWSHYVELLPIKNINEIEYYINQSIKLNLSRNELRTKIKNKEYKRLPEETKIKLVNKEKTKPRTCC